MKIKDLYFSAGRGLYVSEDTISSSRFVSNSHHCDCSLIEVHIEKDNPYIDLTDKETISKLFSNYSHPSTFVHHPDASSYTAVSILMKGDGRRVRAVVTPNVLQKKIISLASNPMVYSILKQCT